MLGQMASSKTLVEIWQTENAWSTEADSYQADEVITRGRYAIAPLVLLQAQREARARHLKIIGIYHSHPDSQAIPSDFDRIYAWQEYSYVIVSVHNGKACEVLSWSLDDDHQFQPEKIVLNEV